MNDLISRSALLKKISKIRDEYCHPYVAGSVLQAPAVDAVPVVRCRDCKRFLEYCPEYKNTPIEGADGDCLDRVWHSDDRQYHGVTYNDFCSYGERRNGDG